MKITHPSGAEKNIKIEKMGAMEGWEIQRRFIEFVLSKDPVFRTEYTMQVLSFAKVVVGSEQELPLSTGALIDNHLGNWENIKKVFDEVLISNGINPETHAEKEHYWAHAGGELAAAFVGSAIELIGPLMGAASKKE